MKKLLILLFSLFFLSTTSVFADDISDFQIEGINIGDSLLDFMTEDEILEEIERTKDWYHFLKEPNKYVNIFLEGEFLIKWNDDGSEELKIKKYDTISIPPGVCRSFTNIGKVEGLLQVIISGGVHDMNDISFTPYAAKEMNDIEPELAKKFEDIGFKFDAGV